MDEEDVELAHRIRVSCLRVARRVRFEGSRLAPSTFTVLAKLETNPRTAAELAAIERISPASMSRTIKDLLRSGYVTRAAVPEDGRQLLISPTEAGLRMLQEARQERDDWMVRRLETCTDDERRVLGEAAAILDRLACQELP